MLLLLSRASFDNSFLPFTRSYTIFRTQLRQRCPIVKTPSAARRSYPTVATAKMGGGPDKPQKLLMILNSPEPKDITDKLRKDHPHLTLEYYDKTKQDIPSDVYKDATILFTLGTFPDDPKKQAPSLSWCHFYSAGINQVVGKPLWTDTDITLTTSSGVHGPQIAEWVIMTLLNHQHYYLPLHDLQKEHHWGTSGDLSKNLQQSRDSVGQRIGILGYGSIGRQVARVCQAMGMDVLAYTASEKKTPESKKDHDYYVPGIGDADGTIPTGWYSGLDKENLHNFLKQDLDFLLVSVPLTPDTEQFLDASCFDILSARKTFISNISRGKIINQADLIDALKAGKLRGAALDVADPEPLPADNELWDLPNVIITPHISGIGKAYTSRSFQILDINLTRMEKGEKLLNVVDRKKGY